MSNSIERDFLQTTLKECSGSKFYDDFEKYFGFQIPLCIKKILHVNSYDSAITLSKFDTNSIKEMEEFMRQDFSIDMLQENERTSDYLGIFVNDQKKFKFLGGHLRVLRTITESCQHLYRSERAPPLESDSLIAHQDGSTVHHSVTATADYGLFNTIGSHMLTVFNDAKRVTLSAWSWPSRQVAAEMANHYKKTSTSFTTVNFQYLTPSNHAEFLNCIVQSDIEIVQQYIRDALAISLRLDGSVDRAQEHNVYVMAHIVKRNGTIFTLFLGFGVPAESGVLSYLQCLKDVVKEIVPWEQFFKLVTSVVTDGENLNKGRINGLCVLLQRERRLSLCTLPLFSLWCIGHRINLAWKSVCKIKIVADIITTCRKLSTYFRKSGTRTYKLKVIAKTNNLTKPLRYPKYFAVRWSEFTFSLFNVVLRNWRASIKYFKLEKEASSLNQCISYDRIHLLTFLADLTSELKTFQKLCQSDSLCITDLVQIQQNLIENLEDLEDSCSEAGWEKLFLEKTIKKGRKTFLYGQKLKNARLRRHLFTNNKRKSIIRSLINHLKLRFSVDADLQNALQPLVKLQLSTTQHHLKLCHSLLVPEVDEATFLSEYYVAADLLKDCECNTSLSSLRKLVELCSDQLHTTKCALARIVAAKPHSADVERLINVYNKFKDSDRSSLSLEVLANYLYIHTNMGTLDNFDPAPAVMYWMNQRKRRAKSSSLSRYQEWFSGVFEEASTKKHTRNPKIEF